MLCYTEYVLSFVPLLIEGEYWMPRVY